METDKRKRDKTIFWTHHVDGNSKIPKIDLYWFKDPAYAPNIPSVIMLRNRFELLLQILQLSDNENENVNDWLYKVRVIIDMLNENFQKYYDPSEIVYVDEFLILFQSRIISKEY